MNLVMSGKYGRAVFFYTGPWLKISIANATLPENLIRITRNLIENILAAIDYFSVSPQLKIFQRDHHCDLFYNTDRSDRDQKKIAGPSLIFFLKIIQKIPQPGPAHPLAPGMPTPSPSSPT